IAYCGSRIRRDRRTDRLLCEYAGAAGGPRREAEFSRAARESEGGDAGGVCASGHAVREAGGGTRAAARPLAAAAVSDRVCAPEPAAGGIGIAGAEAAADRERAREFEVRFGNWLAGDPGRVAWRSGIRDRPV